MHDNNTGHLLTKHHFQTNLFCSSDVYKHQHNTPRVWMLRSFVLPLHTVHCRDLNQCLYVLEDHLMTHPATWQQATVLLDNPKCIKKGKPVKTQICAAMKPIFRGGKNVHRKNNWGWPKKQQKKEKIEAPVLALHQIPAHIRSEFTWLSPVSVTVIVNTAAGCYFRRQSLPLNAVTPTRFCAMFWQRKKWMFCQFLKIHHVCHSSWQSWRKVWRQQLCQ